MITDSLDYLTRVDTFYQNSFETLFNTVSLLFGGAMILVGLVIPIVINYFQRKDYHKLIDDTIEKFDAKLATATTSLGDQTENAENRLSESLDLAVRTLNRQINNNENHFVKVIESVERVNEEKMEHLRNILTVQIESIIKSNLETATKNYDKLQENIRKEINTLESEFNREISISKGYVFYFKALSLIESQSYQEAFENSLISSNQFIISQDIEMLCITSTLMLESYHKFTHKNLLKYWTSSLESNLKTLLSQTKNKRPSEAHDNFYKLITKIEKDLKTYPSQNN